MKKSALLLGGVSDPFVGVYHYKITPAHWTTFENQTDNNNYGFSKNSTDGNHGSAELIGSSGEDFNLSAFFYKDLKMKGFFCYDESKSLYLAEGYIEIDGEIREFDTSLSYNIDAGDGTFVAPHDIIRPACTSGKPFDLKIYVLSFQQ